jgi:hypothetical protein
MSAGYQVILDDLADASATFSRESKTYADIMPGSGPSPVDGGDGAFNDSLGIVLEAIGGLHLGIAGSIEGHSQKLNTAHGNYAKQEVSVRELFDDISDPASIK